MAGVDKLTSFVNYSDALAAAVIATDTDTNSTGFDLKDFFIALFVMTVGTYTDGDFTMKLQDSPDDSVWTDVPAGDTINVDVDNDTNATTILAAAGTKKLGYIGVKRFVRAVVTSATTTTGATVGVMAIRGHKRNVNTDAGA